MKDLLSIENKQERLDYLRSNKSRILTEKKAAIKYSTGINYGDGALNEIKESGTDASMVIQVVANSTNILDSHQDVHIPGNYDESISKKEGWVHLKDHKQVSDSHVGVVKNVTAEQIPLSALGIQKAGTTECLVYSTEIMKELDSKIFTLYKMGLINQHSIGMRYREVYLASDDEETPQEKALFDQYIGQIINRSTAEQAGFFWVVKNIELLECSAVLLGSNQATPTLPNNNSKAQRIRKFRLLKNS